MTNSPVQVFVATFGNEKQATDVLTGLKKMDRDGSLELVDAAVVVRRADGKVKFEETADPSGKKWAKRGAIAGGLVGLIFPPSILVSAAVGGAGGGIWGKIRDKGFDDAELRRVGDSLPPGGSAIIAIAEDRVIQQLQQGIESYEDLASYALSADAAALITVETSEET
jgi:uncharacterized membrane protein